MVAVRTDGRTDGLEGLQNRSDLRRQMKIYNRAAAAAIEGGKTLRVVHQMNKLGRGCLGR